MGIASVLPLIVVSSIVAYARSRLYSLQSTLVYSALVFLGIVAVSSELLSLFGALRPGPILVWWGVCGAAGVALMWRGGWSLKDIAPPRSHWLWLAYASLALTLIVAIAAPPNTWDGMTYHLPRVVHWLENGSFAFYPTAITRQNEMPPLAEEVMLHLQALSGGDRLANLQSWSFFALSLIAIYGIGREVGLSEGAASFCTGLASCVPMAIFQATSCKNDCLTAFLILAFAYCLTRLAKDWTLRTAAWAGCALGLGLYCKGTVLIIGGAVGFAFVLVHVVLTAPVIGRRAAAGRIVTLLIVAALIPLPHVTRDLIASRHATKKSDWTATLGNEDFAPQAILANLMRDSAVHLSSSDAKWNAWLQRRLAQLLGPELNNPRTTFLGKPFSVRNTDHEDFAGNPLHFLMVAGAVVIGAFRWRRLTNAERFVGLSVALGFIAFAVTLKWQEWLSRLETPLFLLGCVAIGSAASQITREWTTRDRVAACTATLAIAALGAVPALFFNTSRPLVAPANESVLMAPRDQLYFRNWTVLYADYAAVDRLFRRSQLNGASIAVLCGEDDWEYPLYVFSGQIHGAPAYRFHQLDPSRPDSVFLAMGDQRKALESNSRLRAVFRGPYLAVYVPK